MEYIKRLLLLSNKKTRSGPVYDPDYQAVLTKATSLSIALPTDAEKLKQSNFIKDLKSAGIWQSLDMLMLFNQTIAPDFGLINLVNPNHVSVKSGTPLFESGKGYKGNGIDFYISTPLNLSTTTKYQLNSASRFAWVYDNAASNTFANQVIDGNGVDATNCMFAGKVNYQRVNNMGFTPGDIDLSGVGLRMITRSNATSITGFTGATAIPQTIGTSAITNTTQFILRRTTSAFFGNIGIGCYGVGADLSSKATQLNTLLINYFAQ